MTFMRYIGVDYPGAQTPTASLKGLRFHFWSFDDWKIPADCSVVAEVYPALWSQEFVRFEPDLSPQEEAVAQVEGWILGVV